MAKEDKKKLTMPRQRHLHPRQPPLRMRRPKHPRPSHRTQARLLMIRHEKLPRRFLLKPLLAAPRHILDHQERAVGDEDHIQRAMRNHRFIQSFNDGGQD